MTKEAELEVKQSRVLLGDSLHVFNHNYSKLLLEKSAPLCHWVKNSVHSVVFATKLLSF